MALLTPPGEGGIGVIGLAGPGALALVQPIFRARRPADLARAAGRLLYGHLVTNGETVDEVLLAVTDASADSQAVEINCHGGIVAVERVLAELQDRGAMRVPAGDLAVASLDAVRREADEALPRARSRQAVRMLLAQYDGELSRAANTILALPPGDAAPALHGLLATARVGLALCTPRRVVIAGSPNTGKSTLFNALVGKARAIVTDIPGTTRDYICETVVIDDVPLELVDTAGLCSTDHIIEIEGINRARSQISAADVVLLVVDASRPLTAEEQQIAADLAAGAADVVPVLNKIDLLAGDPAFPFDQPIGICAREGTGLKELERRIVGTLTAGERYTGGPCVFTPRQRGIIHTAAQAAERGDPAFRQLLTSILSP